MFSSKIHNHNAIVERVETIQESNTLKTNRRGYSKVVFDSRRTAIEATHTAPIKTDLVADIETYLYPLYRPLPNSDEHTERKTRIRMGSYNVERVSAENMREANDPTAK